MIRKRNAGVTCILKKLGSFLAQFQRRYDNRQHYDFQPSNIFYDAPSGNFTLVDVADLGFSGAEGDVALCIN